MVAGTAFATGSGAKKGSAWVRGAGRFDRWRVVGGDRLRKVVSRCNRLLEVQRLNLSSLTSRSWARA